MLVLDGVDEVVLERFDDEMFVVHEEDILGNGDGLIAVVDRGGGVEELEALAVAFVFGRGIFDEGVLKEAVQLAGANDLLGVVADAGDRFEDVLDGVTFHGGDADERGVVEEEEFAAQVFFGRFNASRLLSAGMEEVELVGDDEAGFLFLLDEAGDLAILGGHAGGEIDDEKTEVGASNGAFAAHGGEDFDGVFHTGPFSKAGGVDEVVFFVTPDIGDIDSIAGGAGDFGDDGSLVLEDGINEGRLSSIGLPDDGNFKAVLELFVIGLLLLAGLELGELGVNGVGENVDPAAVFGGGWDTRAEPEAGEVAGGVVVIGTVGLVHDEDDVGIGFAEKLGDLFVDGVDPGAGIDHEDDEVGGVHGNAGLEGDGIGKAVFIDGADPPGVDKLAGSFGDSARSGDAVPGDSRLVVNDGNAPPGQTIEEG